MKLLFTSVGRRVELMQAFRQASEKIKVPLVIYGADVSSSAPALFYCNKWVQVCRITDPEYIPTLLQICSEEKIDALIPTIDTDLLCLAEHREEFERSGTKVFISAPDKIRLCRDKRFTSDFFVQCGLRAPMPVDDYTKYSLGFPAFIKPKDGSSSINAFRVENEEDLKNRAESIEGYIVQPFISGREYTVDIFCDFNHNPIFITPRERLAVRSGEVLKTQIFQDERIIEECKKLIAEFEPVGAITVQLIRDNEKGEDYYIEINPRFGGGAPLSMKAGADSAEAVLRLLEGEVISFKKAATDEAIYSRFDQCVCIDPGKKPEVKAVIFDLDDTLYGEKEYVLSGFRAIERETGISAEEFYQVFEKGKAAIDTVLARNGKIEMKEKCLEIYRNQKPDIHLYEGAKELIAQLKDKGIFVGIITDGRPEGQRSKLNALGLEVDRVIITDELGGTAFRKPCDIPFRIMQKTANIEYGKMVYIGDNPRKDFLAPRELGMQTVLFQNKDGLYYEPVQERNGIKVINNLKELIPLLGL